MREGKNREVKNVLGHLGLAVNRLIRVSFGPFQLGDLPTGAVEEVRTRHLREQLGEKLAASAGLDFAGPIAEQTQPGRPRSVTLRCERSEPRRATAPMRPYARGHTRAVPFEGRSAGLRMTDRDSARARTRTACGEPRQQSERWASPKRRGATAAPPQEALMRIVGGEHRGRALAAPHIARDPPDRRPPARKPVQHPRPCLWRSGHRRARARSVRRHRRARARGVVARCGLCAVRRRRRGGARAHPRECRGARARRRRRRIFRRDATRLGAAHPLEPFSLVFLDPPYGRGLAEKALASARAGGWLAPDALIVVEEAADAAVHRRRQGFAEIERRRYDDTELIFLRTAAITSARQLRHRTARDSARPFVPSTLAAAIGSIALSENRSGQYRNLRGMRVQARPAHSAHGNPSWHLLVAFIVTVAPWRPRRDRRSRMGSSNFPSRSACSSSWSCSLGIDSAGLADCGAYYRARNAEVNPIA